MGLGDAALAGLLGWYLGWLGWRDAFWGIFLGSVLAAGFATWLMSRGRARWKSELTYGPFLLAGAALVLLVG
jgi:leader peptidase (prepilin peptidase)/N-methyltransferase